MTRRPAPRRTGFLVLQSQILLEDLARGLPPAVREDLTKRIVPLLRHTGDEPRSEAHDLARALLEFQGLDDDPGADDELPHPFLGPYIRQSVSADTGGAVAKLRVRGGIGTPAAVLSDPDVGGGGDWDWDGTASFYDPLKNDPDVEVLRPFGRTLATYLELTSGDLSQCIPPIYEESTLDTSEGIRRLCEHLAPLIQAKIGGSEYLAENLENGCLTVLATTVGAFLAHPDVQRNRGKRSFIRGDLYKALLESLVPIELHDIARRLLEADHPRHSPREVSWPLVKGGSETGPLHLLELNKGRLVLRPGLERLLQGLASTNEHRNSVWPSSFKSSYRSNYDEDLKGSQGEENIGHDDLLSRLAPLDDLISSIERIPPPHPKKRRRSNYARSFSGNELGNDPDTRGSNPDAIPVTLLGWERHPSDRDLAEVRTSLTPEMIQGVFHEGLEPTQFGILYREIQLNGWARFWGGKHVGPLARKWTKGWATPHNDKLFAKYKDAAAKLEQFYSWLYSRFLTAVIENQPLPSLPSASLLIAMPKLTRGLEEEAKARVSRDVLTPGSSSRIVEVLHHDAHYGQLPQELIPDIKQIEQLSEILLRSTEVVHRISAYIGTAEVRDQVARRYRVLATRLDELRALLPVAESKSGKSRASRT